MTRASSIANASADSKERSAMSVSPILRLCRSRSRRLVTYPPCLLASILAAGLIFATSAISASSIPDGNTTRCWEAKPPPVTCRKLAAVVDLRTYMSARFGLKRLYWTAEITCTGSASGLRWRCAFENAAEHGWAFVSLGSAPGWRWSVRLGQLVCADPSRSGC